MVSAYHPRHVGLGAIDGLAGGDHRGGGVKKKSGAPAEEALSGGVQGQPWSRLPLSVPKMRRLLWRLGLAVQQTARHILAWSQWRRRHQSRAQYYHDKRRGALA